MAVIKIRFFFSRADTYFRSTYFYFSFPIKRVQRRCRFLLSKKRRTFRFSPLQRVRYDKTTLNALSFVRNDSCFRFFFIFIFFIFFVHQTLVRFIGFSVSFRYVLSDKKKKKIIDIIDNRKRYRRTFGLLPLNF